MKKLLLLIGVVFLFSCESEELFCWKCETKTGGEIISTVITCGMPEADIMDFQAGIESGISSYLKYPVETICAKK